MFSRIELKIGFLWLIVRLYWPPTVPVPPPLRGSLVLAWMMPISLSFNLFLNVFLLVSWTLFFFYHRFS